MTLVRALCLLLLSLTVARAADFDLAVLSLEELMEIEVELVSRRPAQVSDVPAAITVLTADDLRRTGARQLPDALRLIPGMNVARVDANKWAVTSRGFNGPFANKLLVLIDGRSVYTPAFSGVFWEAQDVVMADVERIEMIRGPGGSLWGANAVNGIINVVTKSAADTETTYIELGTGTSERLGLTAHHGLRVTDNLSLRVFGRHFDRRASIDAQDRRLDDDWSVSRLGARADWAASPSNRFSLHVSGYDGEVGAGLQLISQLEPPYVAPVQVRSTISGNSVLGIWKHDTRDGDNLTLQVYYDHTERSDPGALTGVIDVVDLDVQHRRSLGGPMLTWGLGYRGVRDDVDDSFSIRVTPDQRTTHLSSGFVQLGGTLGLATGWSVGSKIEHNSYTGFEAQPGARVWWTPQNEHMLWAAVSRAIRTPSRSDNDMEFAAEVLQTSVADDSTRPTLVTLKGSTALQSENLLALELGYRARLQPDVSVDVAMFINRYGDLRTSDAVFPQLRTEPLPHFYLPLQADNNGRATTWGVESSLTWQVVDAWRLVSSYSLLHMDLELVGGSSDPLFLSQQDEAPRHTASLRSMLELGPSAQLDLVARFIDDLPAQDIDSYVSLDAIAGWQLSPELRLTVAARHLLDNPHAEYAPQVSISPVSQVEPDLHITVSWSF